MPAKRAQKEILIGPSLLWWRQSMFLHSWCRQGPCKPSSCATFTLNSHWGTATTGKKKLCAYAHKVALVVSDFLGPCRLWPTRLLCQGGGVSKQEHWSVLPNTGCHTLLLLQSHFSRVRLCATPETAAHQALPSLGFSRQEHWSGLPFPSPMHENEK